MLVWRTCDTTTEERHASAACQRITMRGGTFDVGLPTDLLIKSAIPSCTNDDRKSVACNLSRASLNDLRVGEKDLLQGLRPLRSSGRVLLQL